MARRALRWVRPYLAWQVGLAAAMLASTALSLVYPLILRQLFDRVFQGNDPTLVPTLALGLVGATLLSSGLGGAAAYTQAWVTARVLVDLRMAFLDHLHRLDLEFHRRQRLGDLLTRLGSDLNEVQQVASGVFLQAFGAVTTLVVALLLLAWLEPLLLAVSLAFAPVLIALVALFRPRVQARAMAVKRAGSDLAASVAEGLQHIRFVQASAAESSERRRFLDQNRALVAQVLGFQRLGTLQGGATQGVLAVNTALVLVVGAALVRQGRMTVGDLVAFGLYQARLYGPAQGLAGLYLQLQRARAAMARVFEVLDREPLTADGPGARDPGEIAGAVAFRGVSFGWDPARPVLQDLDFDVPAGGSLAVVGASGVGKTTLVDLLFRLHHPTAGRVCIDGLDLRELQIRPLRRQMALVGQEPVLFRGTLRDNLLVGLERPVSEAELREALGDVGLLDTADARPEGIDMPIGERGAGLSQGQSQRVALARALLRRPRILVLDEVTASLDWESDRRIAASLDRLRAGATTIVITHRLGLAAACDRVAVLREGRLVQTGRHADLVRLDGDYRRMWLAWTASAGDGPEAAVDGG